MKKILCAVLTIFASASLVSCGNRLKNTEFKPSLDKNTACDIKIVGSYDNFESLEAEFDRFNAYYPKVRLSYTKPDDYFNKLGDILDGNDKPNIFFSSSSMLEDEKYNSAVAHMEDLSDPELGFGLNNIREGLIKKDEQGKTYMVPVLSRTYGALINNNLYKEAKVQIPNTWNELLDSCQTLIEKGYESPMMGYSIGSMNCLMNTIAYPMCVVELANNPEALAKANALDSDAGEFMRGGLTIVDRLIKEGAINLDKCDDIQDNYNAVILRFFEGDVPMMICRSDGASGTSKREERSEAFTKHPFKYSYIPIPLTNNGGYFIDSPAIEFSVNKDCDNLEMTNEFMRFLLTTLELNIMACNKRLVSPTKEITFDPFYAPFANIPEERTFSPEMIGISEKLTTQISNAAFKVGRGELSIDQAIEGFGTL